MDVLLEGAKPPNNSIQVFLDPSVWGKALLHPCKKHVVHLFELYIGAQKSLALSIQQQRLKGRESHPKGKEGE